MADIKSNLRELSVVVGIYIGVNRIHIENTPQAFVNICKIIIPKEKEIYYKNIIDLKSFSTDYIDILKNGYKLANEIIAKFNIIRIDKLSWYGFDTQKEEPYDISINEFYFSLKEESFILENMGLYKLINCFTDSSYKKRHIFKDYAPTEFNEWFQITWDEMVSDISKNGGKWEYFNKEKKYLSTIEICNDRIVLKYCVNENTHSQCILPEKCNVLIFEKETNTFIREKVFAKYINSNLKDNKRYCDAKKKCAIVSANSLIDELKNNLNYKNGLPRFLQIYSKEYYYAKTTSTGVSIFKVPSKQYFNENIIIDSIIADIPESQANIVTTIRNIKTGKILVLRNECRYSHGQFNGTPESKL